MSNQNSSDQRLVLVTGGSRGIGKGLVLALAREGYRVAFTYHASGEAALAVESEVRGAGGRAAGHRCDGRDFDQVEQLCQRLADEHGEPYALINNMGITGDQLVYHLSSDQYRDVVATNLDSAVYFSKCLVAAMSPARRGRIINMSSVTALKGNKGQLSYAATKAGMLGITRTLALELARFRITVNAIAPGYIATEMVEQIAAPARRTITDGIPLKRLGRVEEVASLATFLLSDAAGYITGQTFVIDGGLSA